MATSTEMTAEQKAMMHETMESKAAVGMRMMALPPPSIAEYALTKGMHDAGPNAPKPELVIPIAEGRTITARRTSVTPVAGGYAWHGVVEGTGEARHAAVVALRQNRVAPSPITTTFIQCTTWAAACTPSSK